MRRVDAVGEYNINSRDFANESKLGRTIIVRPRNRQKQQLTRCHQTSYIVLLILDSLPDCDISISSEVPSARRERLDLDVKQRRSVPSVLPCVVDQPLLVLRSERLATRRKFRGVPGRA